MINRIKEILLLLLFVFSFISCGKKNAPSASGIIKEYDSVKFDYFFVEGIKLKVLGNAGEALKFFEQCEKINPESGAVYYQIAQILMANGDINGGKKYLKSAIENEQGNNWYLLMMAATYYQQGALDSAILFYEKATTANKSGEDMLMTLANLYSENKKYEKANEILESFDQKYGVNQSSTVAAVKNLILAGRYDDAELKALLLLKEFPDEILYNGLLAEIYRGKGQQEKAMDVYNKLLERNPDNAETQLSLCDFLIEDKKYDDLFLLLNKVILNENIARDEKLSLFARMIDTKDLVNESSEKLKLAMMIMEAMYQNDQIIQLLRPELLSKEKNYKEAALRLEEIIKIQPENYFAWEKLLLVYLDVKDFKNLEKNAKECATKFNRSFLAKILYATGAVENGNYDTSLEELRKAAILAGSDRDMNMQVLSMKADVLYKMKNYEEAFKTFNEAINIDGEDLGTLNNYAYYLAEQNVRLKEAEIMAKKVIESDPENYTFLDTYGWVIFKRGKIKEAEKIFRQILEESSETDAEYYEHYGFVMSKRKKCREATASWESAIKADSTKSYLNKEIENCRSKR